VNDLMREVVGELTSVQPTHSVALAAPSRAIPLANITWSAPTHLDGVVASTRPPQPRPLLGSATCPARRRRAGPVVDDYPASGAQRKGDPELARPESPALWQEDRPHALLSRDRVRLGPRGAGAEANHDAEP